jgi:hypothetical protein
MRTLLGAHEARRSEIRPLALKAKPLQVCDAMRGCRNRHGEPKPTSSWTATREAASRRAAGPRWRAWDH